MFNKKRFFLLIIVLLILAGVYYFVDKTAEPEFKIAVSENDIVIATFNTKFLGDFDVSNNSKFGNFGKNIRTADNTLLKNMNKILSAFDIIALQEVENEKAVEGLVKYMNSTNKNKNYNFFIEERDFSPQDLAFIWDENKVNIKLKRSFNRNFNVIYNSQKNFIRFSRKPIYCIFEKNDVEFMLVNVHLKSKAGGNKSERDNFIRRKESEKLVEWIDYQQKRFNNSNVIILGDFNDTLNKNNSDETDLTPLIKKDNENKIKFITNELVKSSDNFTTYQKYNNSESKGFIDHIIATSNMLQYYVKDSCNIYYHNKYEKLSDHNPVYAVFNFNKLK